MASYIPNSMKGRLVGDNAQISTAVDLEADTIKGMLLTSSHTPDIDAEVFIDDVSANEVGTSGTYTTGAGNGFTITPTSSTDDTNDLGKWDAVDPSATGATITARYLVLYKWTGTAGTSPIIAVIDFGSDQTSTAGTFAVTFNASGILTLALA